MATQAKPPARLYLLLPRNWCVRVNQCLLIQQWLCLQAPTHELTKDHQKEKQQMAILERERYKLEINALRTQIEELKKKNNDNKGQ